MVRVAMAGSIAVALASVTPAKAAAGDGPQLTPDQRALVLLVVRTELTSHPNEWIPKTPLCFSIELGGGMKTSRLVRAPAEILRSLNVRGRKVFAADQCVARVTEPDHGERLFFYSSPKGEAAYVLHVRIPEKVEDAPAEIEVNLQTMDCAPETCAEIDAYTAHKTKGRWTLAYEGWGAE